MIDGARDVMLYRRDQIFVHLVSLALEGDQRILVAIGS
jgi:hypothetical protein